MPIQATKAGTACFLVFGFWILDFTTLQLNESARRTRGLHGAWDVETVTGPRAG